MNRLKRLWIGFGVKKDAVNDSGNLSKQMEYARLLEKENRFFCVRCIAAEAFLVLGKMRSEEHTSELQSRGHLVCRLLLEKKKNKKYIKRAKNINHYI